MKVLFFFRTWKSYPLDAIAGALQSIVPTITADALMVYQENTKYGKFIRDRSGIKYNAIYTTGGIFERFREDVLDMNYLQAAEEKYGDPNLWNMVYHERYLNKHVHRYGSYLSNPYGMKYSHEEALRWLQAHIKWAEELFDASDPRLCVDVFHTGILRNVVQRVCLWRNIRWLRPSYTGFGDRWHITDNSVCDFPELDAAYRENVDGKDDNKDGITALENFRTSNKRANANVLSDPPDHDMPTVRTVLSPRGFYRYALDVARCLKHQMYFRRSEAKRKQSYRFRQPIGEVMVTAKQMISEIVSKTRGIPRKDYDTSQPFFLYALTTTPEEQTELRGKFYSNEVFVVESLAKSLPMGYKLYVKEHIPMANRRPLWFYSSLDEIPNVEVLSARCNVLDLVRSAAGVATIGGTVGYEAILWGKPVICFGKAYWDCFDGVFSVSQIDQLPDVLRATCDYNPDEGNIAAYLQALLSETVSIPLEFLFFFNEGNASPDYYESEDARRLCNVIATAILEKMNISTEEGLPAESA